MAMATEGGVGGGAQPLARALPAAWYFDAGHYQRELQRIWYRQWLYVGRAAELDGKLSYLVHQVGDQQVLILRDTDGELRAFHNTCRHRGAALCTALRGRLTTRSITCQYHGWSYDLQGRLQSVPRFDRPQVALPGDISLYPVGLRDWHGFLFIRLDGEGGHDLESGFAASAAALGHWPLADLAVGHTHSRELHCNWKIFWENYNECLHCPAVHPALSALVPIYRRGIMEPGDDPDWPQHRDSDQAARRGGLRPGAVTWSINGQACGAQFPDLSDEERRLGYHYLTHTPSMYIAAHVDYVRVVRLRPMGPTRTEINTQWLFPPATLAAADFDLQNVVQFGAQVMSEDAGVCELTQQGQQALAHRAGLLMPEEYDVGNFQQWVRDALAG